MRTLHRPSHRVASLCVAALLCALAPTAASGQESPRERTEALLETFKAVHSAPEGGTLTAAQKQENVTTFARLDGFLDLERFVEASVEPSKAAFDPEQLAAFTRTFRELVRMVAYPDSGEFLRDAVMQIKAPIASADRVDIRVELALPAEDLEMEVTFRWTKTAAGYVVRDVLFDEDSLVVEYQNQFARIIKKDGVVGLMKKLDEKLEEVRTNFGP